MEAIFIKMLNMSITAGWIVLAVLLIRLLFKKKAPKALFPVLWAIVAVRLVCPFMIESRFSLLRNTEPVEKETLSENFFQQADKMNEITTPETVQKEHVGELSQGSVESMPGIENEGYSTGTEQLPSQTEGSIPQTGTLPGTEYIESVPNNSGTGDIQWNSTGTETEKKNISQSKTDLSTVLAIIWLSGFGLMLVYTGFSYFLIYRKVAESVPYAKNVRVCDSIDSPFILGIIRPRIYLPSDIAEDDRKYVLSHERAHLKRLDHIWKPLGFLLLSIYWFHPLLWVAYILLCKDIEYACDEKVIKELGIEQKKPYSTALINCSVSKKMISACPLAFGENGVKGRVKSVLHYKKPAFWIILASVVLCVVLAVCFLTNPNRKKNQKKDIPNVGDIITFGSYEQDNVTENGAEPIEWLVVDVFDGKASLLSLYGLDAKPYHTESESITWMECSLREWLNGEFYETAFNKSEREGILTTKLENYSSAKYGMYDNGITEDKVYLLSIDELFQIFENETTYSKKESDYKNKASIMTATAYAKANGAWEGKNEDGMASPWLLRTPGLSSHHVSRVSGYGELSYDTYQTYEGNTIRPAIRINLSDAEFKIKKEASVSSEQIQTEQMFHTRSGRFKDMVPLEEAKPGYVVRFGSRWVGDGNCCVTEYEMDWYVLDVQDGKALLLSKNVLDPMPYHAYGEEVSWANCTLREWLNGEFYESSFDDEEKKRIVPTLLENVQNPWNTFAEYEYTEDKVFLPAMEEILAGSFEYTGEYPESTAYEFDGYFQTDAERTARWYRWIDVKNINPAECVYANYWLRASSQSTTVSYGYELYPSVVGIDYYGKFASDGTTVDSKMGVRPALWVEIGESNQAEGTDADKQNITVNKEGATIVDSELPERYDYKEVKAAFLTYLNHEAYLHPADYPENKYDCTYDVYCTTDSKMKRLYLKVDRNGSDVWYLCTPTIYMDENAPLVISAMEESSIQLLLHEAAITYLGTDTLKLPTVIKPSYGKSTGSDLAEYKESIGYIAEALYENGFVYKNGASDVIKLEAWISEYDMDKQLLPYVCIVINDTWIYQTSFSKYEGLYTTFVRNNFSKDYVESTFGETTYVPEKFTGKNISLLSAADTEQLERVKECAILHYVHETEFSKTITIDGQDVTLPSHNVEINGYNGIAFVPIKTVDNITYYRIYRSRNAGKTWSLIADDFQTTAGDIAAIEIATDEHIACYFERNEINLQSYCYWSHDGGTTWSMPAQASKPWVNLANAAVGTSVVFGSYDQDGDWDNGNEALEWIVLDRVDDKVLLLSKYGLYTNRFNDELFEEVTWKDSFMRRWLHERFYVEAFSKAERSMILKARNQTETGTGETTETEDYVFFLSADEVLYGKAQDGTPYFANATERMAIPTAENIWECCLDSNNEFTYWLSENAEWWLRTSGKSNLYVSVVTKDGDVSREGRVVYSEDIMIRPAIWVDLSSLSGSQQTDSDETVVTSPMAGKYTEDIANTNISIAIGDDYAAYLDEDGKLHVLYDTSARSEHDPVGATGGIDLTKTYKALGTDPWRLVAIDEDGKLSVSYPMNAAELSAYVDKSFKDAVEHNGNYGTGGPQPWIANDFEGMFGIKQIFSTYPYNTYTVLFENGAARRDRGDVSFLNAVQITDATDGVIAGLKADGTLMMSNISDSLRKEALEAWPKKLRQICTYTNMAGIEEAFVGLKEDGTVICEGVEHEYLINTIEQWNGIVKIAAGYETIVGLKGDGTVVAVCPGRSDVGQCEVDDWTDVIAINTNGKVTIGITKDGRVLMVGDVPETAKPSHGNSLDLTNEISYIYSELKQNGYRENLKIEVVVSEYDLEKNIYPYAYLIINDSEVFETSFEELAETSKELNSLSEMFFYGNYTKDYTIDYTDGWADVFDGHGIKPLASVDAEQLERVKACAVYHKVFVEEKAETVLIDGEEIEIDSPNIAFYDVLGVKVSIAFLPHSATAGTIHYNVYRSEDNGTNWQLIAEDVTAAEGDISRILIPDKNTVVCYFEISGTTSQSSCIVSKDGGVTWNYASYDSKPNSDAHDPKKGSSVIFGAYEQDGDYSNGKEPLEWLVLDREGDKALLLSKYGIETLLYDKDRELEPWDVDDLYWMMNRTIYEGAFSAKERAALIRSNPIKNESIDEYPYGMIQCPGYTFLLETDDVLEGKSQDGTPFFRTEESRITIPTAYAAKKGAWLNGEAEFTGVEAPWILTVTGTTDGDFSEVAFARVMPDGRISFEEEAIKDQYVMIRPAIWVDVTKIP